MIAVFLLKSFTLSLILCAIVLSSIVCKPVPSTSQTPACAMFHRPVEPLPKKPIAKNSGSARIARSFHGTPLGI